MSRQEAEEWCTTNGCQYFETSAQNGDEVNVAFETAAKLVVALGEGSSLGEFESATLAAASEQRWLPPPLSNIWDWLWSLFVNRDE